MIYCKGEVGFDYYMLYGNTTLNSIYVELINANNVFNDKNVEFQCIFNEKITYILYLKFPVSAGHVCIHFRKVLSDELTKLASLLNQMWFKQPTTNMSPAPVFPSFQ